MEVASWKKGDTAEGKHRHWNKNYCFFKQPLFTGNIKIGDELCQAEVSFDSIGNMAGPSKVSSMQSQCNYSLYMSLKIVYFINLFIYQMPPSMPAKMR